MSKLSDQEIEEFVSTGVLRIDPFSEECLTPNGYDLRLGFRYLVFSEENGDYTEEEVGEELSIRSGDLVLVHSEETIGCPSWLMGEMKLRSTFARAGLVLSDGFVDSGFEGHLTLPLINLGPREIRIKRGDRVVQIAFERLSKPAVKDYRMRSGTYMKSQGVVPSRISER